MKARILPIALLCAALAVAGCGGDDPAAETRGAEAAEGVTPKPKVPQGTPLEAAERAKPKVPQGAPTQDLVARDLVEGTGAVAENGDVLIVRYVSGIYETGEEIESAGTPQKPIGFLLGSGDWSLGWENGMPGMRVGGRRELIFPTTPDVVPPGSELGDTLVYIVDLLEITQPGS